MKSAAPFTVGMLAIVLIGNVVQAADPPIVTIRSDFPGGNIVVISNDGEAIEMKPDLRGGRDWFYWYFEAVAKEPGEMIFSFPEKTAGFKNGAVGFQGPAISKDDGTTWTWMGNETAVIRGRSFSYKFSEPGQKVRFSSSIPYVQQDFEKFVATHSGNSHFATSVLTESAHGRNVELVQIGTPGPDKKAVLFTGRHHAGESIASYLLEGVMESAVSDNPVGKEFRRDYVLYVVPFVDKDGVEEGDQGKGRRPHDHNRDYGPEAAFPEVKAIMNLANEKNIRASLDFHCPTLVMDIHQLMYFAGTSDVPSHNLATVKQFAANIKAELPDGAPSGPLVWLKPDSATKRTMNSGHFAHRPGILMAATLETPFAPRGTKMEVNDIRSYGTAVLKAWNKMKFVDSE